MMNNDLISRSEAIEQVERREKILGSCLISTRSFKNLLMNCPTVDAEPVRHGRWGDTHEYDPFTGIYKCSECGLFTTMTTGSLVDGKKDNYCPNCGAKMDAEVTDDQT